MTPPTRSDVNLVFTEKHNELNVAYILNRRDEGGFMILAADDLMPAVLGYSDSGYFDPYNFPASMSAWLKEYGRQLTYAVSYGIKKGANTSSNSWASIPPLCKSKWNQTEPYNNNCPTINGTKSPTGCTATAIAQVIYKHKWPLTGTGTNTYAPSSMNTPLTFDFGETAFDWENMRDTYSTYNNQEAEAVATLMEACGNASLMEYGELASGAYLYDAIYGMVKFMGYDKSAIVADRDYSPSAEWNEMIYNELANARPVVYSGYNDEGHTFVIDGYNGNGYFHVNWGWGGMSDGYFLITALNPEEQGVGGSAAGYNFNQQAILNVMPAKETSEYQLVVVLNGNFTTSKSAYTSSGNIEFTTDEDGFIKAYTLISQECTLGIKVTPVNGGESVFYPGSTANFDAHYGNPRQIGYNNYYVPASSLPKSGTYTVTPAYSVNGKVKDIAVKVGKQKSLTMTCSNGDVRFEDITVERELTASNLQLDTPLYSGKNCSISATVTNHGEEYLGSVSVALMRSNGIVMSKLDAVKIDVPDGESVNVTFSGIFFNGKIGVTPGNYIINVFDEENNPLCREPLAVTVLNAPAGKPVFTSSYTVSETYPGDGTPSNPYLVGDSFDCGFTINVTSGLFEDTVVIYGIYADDYSEAYLGDDSRYYNNYFVDEGNSQAKTFTFDTSLLDLDRTMFLEAYGWTNDWTTISSGWFGNRIFVKRTTNGTERVEAETQGSIYPNPATSDVTVSAKSPIRDIEIFNLTGSRIKRITPPSGEIAACINVDNIPTGHYIVTVITDKGIERHRLIKK